MFNSFNKPTKKVTKVKRKKSKTGFADTKKIPLKGHPAFYKRKGQDDIEYVTFTHSKKVDIKKKSVKTEPLEKNIDSKDNRKAYVYPIVYEGKRSALRNERKDYKLEKNDRDLVDNLFSLAPREKVNYTSNSSKKDKKLKK